MIRGASIQAVERGAFIGSYSFAFAGTGDQGKSGPAGVNLSDDKTSKRLTALESDGTRRKRLHGGGRCALRESAGGTKVIRNTK